MQKLRYKNIMSMCVKIDQTYKEFDEENQEYAKDFKKVFAFFFLLCD